MGKVNGIKKTVLPAGLMSDLAEAGIIEAEKAGRLLNEQNYHIDIIYTSLLKRAIRTHVDCTG